MKKQKLIKNWWLSGNKYAILIAWAVYCPCYFFAQNIVPNGSFEDKISCPTSSSQFNLVNYWFEPYLCSVDYFSSCGTGGSDVPNNYIGFQYAQDGNSYIGSVVYSTIFSNVREFAEIKLLSSLIQGEKYCISFYASLTYDELYGLNYAINTLGCLLTLDSFLLDSCNQEIFLLPQIENTQGIIADTANWVLISGEFVANGGERFLTIGNFRNDSNTSVVQIDSTAPNSYYSYYYIDDVSVTLCDTTATEELKITNYRMQVFPNPASGSVTITVIGGDEIIITEITGRKIRKYKISNNQLKINTDEYDNGIYFLTLYGNNSVVSTRKLVIAK